MGDNFFTLWPFLMAFFGLYLAVRLLRKPKWRDTHWWLWLSLASTILHNFEETGFDLLGRRFHIHAFVCARLGLYRAEIALCPADAPFFFIVNLVHTWLLTTMAITTGPRRPLGAAIAVAISLIDAVSHVFFAVTSLSYNPGFVTAIFVTGPVGLGFFRTCRDRGWLPGQQQSVTVACGALVLVSFWFGLALAAAGRMSKSALWWEEMVKGFLPLLALLFKRIPLVKMYSMKE
ncbi:hypothetical protein CLOM_g1193 [Closterium sp. NIES-68]|nr:hypothetical protein CLOM_g1193 [Closterium sp. NIES-68]